MLYKQVISSSVRFEIILADDASSEEYRQINKKVNDLPYCKYLQCEENLGPARIRNYLAEQAQYPYLLFLDSDVLPVEDDFLTTSFDLAQSNKFVF